MKALFDIGNTRIKWAQLDLVREQAELYDAGSASHRQSTLADIATANWSDWPCPEQALVSSVTADNHGQQLRDWCIQHWQLKPVQVISIVEQCGVSNAYSKPGELGSDRWAAMIGAHHLLRTDTCVVDCGTAITVDFLDAGGRHLGGYIIPGLQLMQQSLVQRTEAIQLSSWSAGMEAGAKTGAGPGKSTSECSEHGIMLAATALIEGSCKKMETATGKPFHRLLTGGNSGQLAASLDADVQVEANLVLLGLAQIAAGNNLLKFTNRDT